MNTVVTTIGNFLYHTLNPRLATQLAYSPVGKTIFYLMNGVSNHKKIYNTSDNIKLLLTPKEALGLGIFHIGTVNKHETKLMKKVLKPGDVVIDIGTYIDSWHTLLAAKIVGNKGKVYAFEPHPVYYERLVDNVHRNKFSNVVTKKLGIYDTQGTYTFFDAEGASSLVSDNAERHLGSKPIKSFTIRTTTLDDIVKKESIKRINFMKIDAEGVEMNILKKAIGVLKKFHPDIIVEVEDVYLKHSGSGENAVLRLLRSYGYFPFEFTGRGLIPFKPGHKRLLLNLFFTKNKNFHRTYNEK